MIVCIWVFFYSSISAYHESETEIEDDVDSSGSSNDSQKIDD